MTFNLSSKTFFIKEKNTMKLKTLLLIVAILCVSLFVVACNGEETTAANDDPQGGDVTTTAKAVTTTKKATTTKKTTVTTTTVTTTLDPNYKTKLPAKLPDGSTFDIHTRVGLDSIDDYVAVNGNFTDMAFTETGAIYGKAISMKVDPAKNSRIEAYVDILDPFTPEGVKGIMWYVDFSAAVPVEGKAMCTSTTINTNTYRSKVVDGVEGSGKGYYYKDGAWVETQAINACRMEIPSQFKGWVYVPITSYNGAGDLFDAATKTGLGNVFVQNIRLYTDHYDYATSGAVIFDEVVYVK